MRVTLDVTSATSIDDPVRPAGAISGLFYRGSGHFEAESEAAPLLDLKAAVDDGDAIEVGDLVLMSVISTGTPTWANPSGWTIIDNKSGGTRDVILFKEVSQADLDSPMQPLGSAVNTLMQWGAFNPAPSGAPASDLLDQVDTGSNPAPVSLDASAVSDPHVLFSVHGSNSNGALTSPVWIGPTPDFTFDSFISGFSDKPALTMKHRVYVDESGEALTADMNDEGSNNYQAVFIIKYV